MTDLADRQQFAAKADGDAPADGAIRPIIRCAASSSTTAPRSARSPSSSLMMAIFSDRQPARVHDLEPLQLGADHAAGGALLVVPLVFVVTAGEIDLSFPATMGFSVLGVRAGGAGRLRPVPRHRRRHRHRHAARLLASASLVVYADLSSLIATLGMNFLLRGLIQIINEGKSTALVTLSQSWAYKIFSSQVWGMPVQIFWAIAFVDLRGLPLQPPPLRRAGAGSSATTPTAPSRWASTCKRVRVKMFVFVGMGAAHRRHLLHDDQLHLVADGRRRLSAAGAGLGLRRRHADLGRHRHRGRRRDRRAHGVVHPDRRCRARA